MKRPHVIFPEELTPDMQTAIQETFPGSGERNVPITPENWQSITDAMAATLGPGGTAGAMHLEGIDFAGKTGTAQLVSHSAGATSLGKGSQRANAWFVGMAPRRNPDIVVAVLCEHGGWGAEASAPIAAQVVNAYVNKHRKLEGNLRAEAVKPAVTPVADSATDSSSAPTANSAPSSTPKPASSSPSKPAQPAPKPATKPEGTPTAAILPKTKLGISKPTEESQP